VQLDGMQAAIKQMAPDWDFGQGNQGFFREINALSQLKHDNVVKLLGYNNGKFDDTSELYLVMALMQCDLTQLLKNRPSEDFPYVTRLEVQLGCWRGLAHLHKNKYMHWDVKPPNICESHYIMD